MRTRNGTSPQLHSSFILLPSFVSLTVEGGEINYRVVWQNMSLSFPRSGRSSDSTRTKVKRFILAERQNSSSVFQHWRGERRMRHDCCALPTVLARSRADAPWSWEWTAIRNNSWKNRSVFYQSRAAVACWTFSLIFFYRPCNLWMNIKSLLSSKVSFEWVKIKIWCSANRKGIVLIAYYSWVWKHARNLINVVILKTFLMDLLLFISRWCSFFPSCHSCSFLNGSFNWHYTTCYVSLLPWMIL